MRKQAARFGAELVTDDVTEVDLTGPVKVVHVGDAILPRPRGDLGDRLEVPLPRARQRGPAARPRRLGLCDLRRLLLPRPGHRRRRRRRLRARGSHLPDASSRAASPSSTVATPYAPARSCRTAPRERQDRVPLEQRGDRRHRRRQGGRRRRARHRHRCRRRTVESPACSSPSVTTRAASCSAARSTSTTPAT